MTAFIRKSGLITRRTFDSYSASIIFFSRFVILIAGIVLSACDGPIGLGSIVDASAPVLDTMSAVGRANAAVPGGFITGTRTLYINATDDTGIRSVTLTYTYFVHDGEGNLLERTEENVRADWNDKEGCYSYDIDTITKKMADGTLRAVVTATDSSGKKTVSSPLIYTVKNKPPALTMQIPKPVVTREELSLTDYPEVLTNNYLMGTYEDLAGVALGYPRIKFWKRGSDEPDEYSQNAGWENVNSYADDPGGGWVYADEGKVENEKGERGGSFRYYLRERKSGGQPDDENEGKQLLPGFYNLKVQAMDINGLVREWPRDAFSNEPEYFTVLLYKQTQAQLPPELTVINPPSGKNGQSAEFFREDFFIEAVATVSGEGQHIAEMVFEVSGKNNKRVVLRKWIGSETGSGVPASFRIELGKTYYCLSEGANAIPVDNEAEVPPGAFSSVTFADGNYSFFISARDNTGLDSIYPLSVYIDRQPPVTSVTGLSPYFSRDNVSATTAQDAPENNITYRRWTVNGSVQIGVSSSDSRGNALDEKNGYMKFKYIFSKDKDICEDDFNAWKDSDTAKTFGEFLYTRPAAVFFDEKKETPGGYVDVSGADGVYTLSLQTHKWPGASDRYLLWFYIVSMDNAGNISYAKILLNADQKTDIPGVSITGINADGSTFMGDKSVIPLSVTDDDGLTAESVFYRYAKDASAYSDYAADASKGWYQIPARIEGDATSIRINNLSLHRIACDHAAHPFDHNHTMDIPHKNALGAETQTKYIQVRAVDDAAKKIYPSDGQIWGYSEWREFTIDLTYPAIVVSLTDQAGNPISRDNDDPGDPFILPRKEESYKRLDFAYGDLIEHNLESVTMKIDGEADKAVRFTVPASIPTLISGEPAGTDFAVWKTVGSGWNGELRWRVPLAGMFNSLDDGLHTFEIGFEDKIPQTTTRSLTFSKDSNGPNVSLIVPGRKIYLSDEELAVVTDAHKNNASIPGLPVKIAEISAYNTIVDTGGRLIGNFTDNFSHIFSSGNKGYWYRLEGGDASIAGVWRWVAINEIKDSKTAAWQIPLPEDLDDGYYRLSVRVKDSHGNGYDNTDTLTGQNGGPGFENNLAFMLERGIPQLHITSPDPWPEMVNNGLTIEGQISGVFAVSGLGVRLNGNLLYEYAGTNTDKIIVEGANVKKTHNYTISIPASVFTEGPNTLVISATGASGQSSAEARNFTFDKTAPAALFNAPSAGIKWAEGNLSNGKYEIYRSGTWVTGQPKIGGTCDDKNGIHKIFYHLGKLNDDAAPNDAAREIVYNAVDWIDTRLDTDNPRFPWSGGLYYWNFCENLNVYQFNPALIEKSGPGLDTISANANRFYLPLYVKVLDRAQNTRIVQYKIFVDPDMDIPQTQIISPAENAMVGGEVRISGTANDNNWIHSVEIRITPAKMNGDTVDFPKYYKNPEDSWVIDQYDGWVKAKIMGSTDMMVNWYYNINGDGKLNPPVGRLRQVQVEVRAVDTKDSAHVQPGLTGFPLSIHINFDSGVPTISIPMITKPESPDREYADGIRVSGNFQISAVVKDEGGISSIRARVSGSSSFTEIVRDGLVIQGNLPVGWAVVAPPEEDAYRWQPGWRYYITDPGTVTNWADIDDTGNIGGKRYERGTMIQYNGITIRGTAKGIKANGRIGIQGDWDSQYFEYTITFNIDSTAIQGLGYGKTGYFTLDLQAYDNNRSPGPYNTNGTYTLGVDNFYPTTEISTQYDAATGNFYVMGTARDYDSQSGSIQTIERMLVYFEKNAAFYNPRGRSPGDTDSFYQGIIPPMTRRPNVRDMSLGNPGYEPNVADFADFPVLVHINKGGNIGEVWESPHAMVIDSQELGATTDTDGDGTFAEMWDGRVDRIWQARLDTTLFPDGPLTVHYVVMDQAGNATHYQKNIYIGNNRPMIREFNLGTDINGSGAVEGDEYTRNPLTVTAIVHGKAGETISNEINTGFRIRNNRFNVKLNTLFGNTRKYYRVSYVDESTRREAGPAAMVRGTVYTIIDDGNTDWTRYGAPNRNIGTTFVASGRADTSNVGEGKVVTYDYGVNDGTEVSGSFATHQIGTGDEAVITFNNFANMPDSANKQYDAAGNMILKRDKRFIIKVYDTTVPGNPLNEEARQLAHAVLINVDFDNSDTRKPSIDLADFGREFILRESSPGNSGDIPLMANNADRVSAPVSVYAKNIVANKGYVQYADHANSGDGYRPSVSGMVIFKGKAADNGRIVKISAEISGYDGGNGIGNAFNIAAWDAGSNALVSANGAHTIAAMGYDDTVEWGFEAEHPNLTLDYGHVCNWNFAWDTSTVTGVVGNDVAITFTAHDAAGIESDPVTVSVNIVPYITEIVTPLSGAYSVNPSAFNRSAQGAYPVREGDAITINGFNLAESVSTKPAVTVGTDAINANRVTVNGKNRVTVIIDNDNTADSQTNENTMVSGPLTVTLGTGAGTVASLNNRNDNGAEYNQEHNGLNNNTLNDDRRLYVWRTGYLHKHDYVTINPFMQMDANTNLYLSYGTYYNTTGYFKVMKNGNDNIIENLNNRYLNTTIAYDAYGDWYAAASNMTSLAGNPAAFTFFARSAATATNGTAGLRKRIILKMMNPSGTSDANRVRIPRISTQHTRPNDNNGNPQRASADYATRIFMSYYDGNSADNAVIFNYGMIGDLSTGAVSQGRGFGGDLFQDNIATSPKGQVVATNTTGKASGMYTATGCLSSGRPLVAWYDRVNQKLWLSYGSGVPSTTTAPAPNSTVNITTSIVTTTTTQWQDNAMEVAAFAGTHVDMAVDQDDNVHLAYYDVQNGGLYYALIPPTGTGNDIIPDKNKIRTARVDTYLSAGTKLMLNVRREAARNVPYISYYHASFAETRNAIRVAWRTDFSAPAVPPDGTYADDSFTGAWEVMTVPVQTLPLADEFICNGVPTGTSTAWAPAPAANSLRGRDISKSILVGYMTEKWYEGAVLKDSLY